AWAGQTTVSTSPSAKSSRCPGRRRSAWSNVTGPPAASASRAAADEGELLRILIGPVTEAAVATRNLAEQLGELVGPEPSRKLSELFASGPDLPQQLLIQGEAPAQRLFELFEHAAFDGHS